jgi:hypothetical protein
MSPKLYENEDGSFEISEPDKYKDLLETISLLAEADALEGTRVAWQRLAWGLGMHGHVDVCELIMKYAYEPEPRTYHMYGYFSGG